MAKVRIEFDTDNEAFTDNYYPECFAVIDEAKRLLGKDAGHATLRDSNGNTVGRVEVVE